MILCLRKEQEKKAERTGAGEERHETEGEASEK